MQKIKLLTAAAIVLAAVSCNNKTAMKTTAYAWPANIAPPVCPVIPKTLTAFGDTRTDNYYWLKRLF